MAECSWVIEGVYHDCTWFTFLQATTSAFSNGESESNKFTWRSSMDELVRFLEEMLLKYGDNIDFSTFPIKEENLYTDE